MGEEIAKSKFTAADFDAFRTALDAETRLLEDWFNRRKFKDAENVGGFELEAWIVDSDCHPIGLNKAFLDAVDNPLVVPELSTFNVEFNTPPARLGGSSLSDMLTALNAIWASGQKAAAGLNARLMMTGILPTVEANVLCLDNVSDLNRFRAINEQLLHARSERPFQVEIDGKDHLKLQHPDVVLEAAATSFQVHLQVGCDEAAAVYNTSIAVSAPLVAVSANSPFLFQHDLWCETRIPLFEQSISINQPNYRERVTFGTRYLDSSLFEMFKANQEYYAIVLPLNSDEPAERLHHLRLHNGTIWRWNRGLIGFDPNGQPHLRIEHRVMPAGPTPVDCMANAAFYFGLALGLAERYPVTEQLVPFSAARKNFYHCARDGLEAKVDWLDQESLSVRELILSDLLPIARQSLLAKELDKDDVDFFLSIIEARTECGLNGATWQRQYRRKSGGDIGDMTKVYLSNQESGKPVHSWDI